MKEIFLMYLWENKLIKPGLFTMDGRKIEVLFPGTKNSHSGPDFLDGRIRIGDEIWAGHIEMHVNASDWYNHRHNSDKAYDNVILHVVYQADKATYTTLGHPIPVVALQGFFDETLLLRYRKFVDSQNWIACEKSAGNVQRFTWLSWLDRMIVERLEMKVEEIILMVDESGNDWEEVFYRRLMASFGFKVNESPFQRLSQLLPFQLLLRHADQKLQLEALLYGVAGMLEEKFEDDYPLQLKKEFEFLQNKYQLRKLNASQWRFMRMRPSNFPTLRIAQMADLIAREGRVFSRILAAETVDEIKNLMKLVASVYWDDHFQFDKKSKGKPKKLGDEGINLIMINAITQVLFAYGHFHSLEAVKEKALMLLEALPAENNSIVRKFDETGIKSSQALQSQALIHLKNHYCNARRCLECRIGQLLVRTGEDFVS